MTQKSIRLKNVVRLFEPYNDRSQFIRLDRNEDPVGYDKDFLQKWLNTITPHDIAAYRDSEPLIGKLANWANVSEDSVYVGAGADAIIKNIFETYIDPGQKILLQDPGWRMYEVYANIYGAQVTTIPYNNALEFCFDDLVEQVRAGTKRMVVLANPNQPTATLFSDQELFKLVELAHKTNTLVVVDEAYHLFTDKTQSSVIKQYNNLLVVRTFSKAFGLAGLRIGYCLADPDRIHELMLLRPVTDANSLALSFAEYLLDNIEFVMNKIDSYKTGRAYVFEQMKQAKVATNESHSNFILVRCYSMEAATRLVDEVKAKGYLLKGPFSKAPLQNCVRITIGPLSLMKNFWAECSESIIKHSANRFNMS